VGLQTKVSNHQSNRCYTNYQTLIKEGKVEEKVPHFGQMQVSPLEKRKMPYSAAQV